jgi:hypothetical protein
MRMTWRMAVVIATVAALLSGATAALAITNGQPDGDNHPYVGLMVALDEDGVPLWRCSGSLLSPTVFLTAGHCTEEPAARVEVWFDEGPVPTDPDYLAALAADPDGIVSCDDSPLFDGYPCQGDAGGTPNPYPGFCTGCGNGLPNFAYRDVGVVVFEEPLAVSVVNEYAELPSPNLVIRSRTRRPSTSSATASSSRRTFRETCFRSLHRSIGGPAHGNGCMRQVRSSPAISNTATSSSGSP